MADIQSAFVTDGINFGDIPASIDAVLQRGVAAHRTDRAGAEHIFRQALEAAPDCLPVYYCLYKVLAYSGQLESARAIAYAGLARAAGRAGLSEDWRDWRLASFQPDMSAEARFALYTLKALAFIALKAGALGRAEAILGHLRVIDPADSVGWRVTEALAEGVR